MDTDFDVIVSGAGPAGCLAARDLAKSGFRVGLFDRNARKNLGKPVIIEAEKDIFPSVGLRPPTAAEIPYHPRGVRVFSSRGVEAYHVDHVPALAIRLDRFVGRLLREAEKAGVVFFEGYQAECAVHSDESICGAVFRHQNRKAEIRSRIVMDATGFDAALVRTIDPALGFGFRPNVNDEVRAANAVFDIDPEKAARAVHEGVHGDEELYIRLGTLGSYSTEFSHLSLQKKRAYVLIGHKEDYDAPPLKELIKGFGTRQGYYGRRLYGGEGLIRIATILDRLVCSGFMALGEAACMVMPINGSGVANALLAGQFAAQTAVEALRRDRMNTEALWPYAARYQRSRGAALATYSAIRLMTESMNTDQVATMLECGLSGPEDLMNTNKPEAFALSPASLPGRLAALIRNPSLALPLLRTIPWALALHHHYLRYPDRFEQNAFDKWRKKSRGIFSRISRLADA